MERLRQKRPEYSDRTRTTRVLQHYNKERIPIDIHRCFRTL